MSVPEPGLGIVIPTLDEARALPRLLEDLRHLALPLEVVVSDGGSRDGTCRLAREAGARVVEGPAGRARQIRAGVGALRTPWLFLLHADCRLPSASARTLEAWLRSADPADSAHFRFSLEGRDPFWRFLEIGQVLRERMWGLVYGDQGLVLSRETWNAVGGVPDLPLMEDVALVDRVRRRGRLHRLDAPLPTSARRYEEDGRLAGWLRNIVLVSCYRLGVAPHRLARLYPTRRAGTTSRTPTVVVFARAPRLGEVKTRLAAGAGDGAALRLYRRMGQDVKHALDEGPWRLVVCYTPEDGLQEVEDWLGPADDYRPQVKADLGERMASALDEALESSDCACVVGTDAPRLDRTRVSEAFRALEDHDLVVGPALDGGYVLLGLKEVHRELFRDIPWSTERVLPTTLARARELGLRVHLLQPMRDVDRVEDVPRAYRPFLMEPSHPT